MDTLEKITYPFTPEYLDELPQKAVKKCWDMEEELLILLCSYFAFEKSLDEITLDDLKELRNAEPKQKEIEEKTSKGVKLVSEETKTVLNDVVSENKDYYTKVFELAKVETPEALADEPEIKNIQKESQEEISNILQNLGFSVDNGNTIEVANAYDWAVNSAITAVESGEASPKQAIANAVRQLAESGIRIIEHESGYTEQVDVYVRRAVMTAVNGICQKYAESSMDYLNTDLVEVTAHIGARNKGGIPENHELWQGKCYRWGKTTQTR